MQQKLWHEQQPWLQQQLLHLQKPWLQQLAKAAAEARAAATSDKSQDDAAAAQQKVLVCSPANFTFLGCFSASSLTLNPLQAAAAARIQGQPGIHQAAEIGNVRLVRDHFVADPTSIHKRDQ